MKCDTCGKTIKDNEFIFNDTMFHGGKSECYSCYKKRFNQCTNINCNARGLRTEWNYCPNCGTKVIKEIKTEE
jgi:hypothetical protein